MSTDRVSPAAPVPVGGPVQSRRASAVKKSKQNARLKQVLNSAVVHEAIKKAVDKHKKDAAKKAADINAKKKIQNRRKRDAMTAESQSSTTVSNKKAKSDTKTTAAASPVVEDVKARKSPASKKVGRKF